MAQSAFGGYELSSSIGVHRQALIANLQSEKTDFKGILLNFFAIVILQ